MDVLDSLIGVYIESPAKINLHLAVLGVREDGYHEIDSIFQLVSLTDEIRIRSLKENNVLHIEGMNIPKHDNIIYRAVEVFRRETGIRSGLSVQITKRIPMGGGLGGGSGNAASVLIGLDRMFGTCLTKSDLSRLGAGLGSDVPFFCHAACARVRGRGEVVESIPARTDYQVILLYPGFGISSQEAFMLLDRERGTYRSAEFDAVSMYRESPPERWEFFNSFFPILAQADERFKALRERLQLSGAVFSGLSGSGSTLFGIFQDEERASRAWKQLNGEGFCVWNVKPLDSGINAIVE